MKTIEIKLSDVKELGANATVILAVINNTDGELSNTDVAKEVGLSFPTAQKLLQELADRGLIKPVGKKYTKI